MSWEVVGLVSKRQCGGAVRRVLLLTLAQYAGHDGRTIFASVPSLARDSEVDARTVQRNIKALMEEGLLELVGKRPCKHGYTNEYRLLLPAIRALPEIIRTEDIADANPRQKVTPVEKTPVTEAEITPDIPPPPAECPPGTVSPTPRQPATQSCQGTSSTSSAADARREIIDRILAACGPGMADRTKTATPMLDLSARIDRWLAAWDLEAEILPVVEAKTKHPRAQPMSTFRFIEQDIAAFHARRAQELPQVEIVNETVAIGRFAGADGGEGSGRSGRYGSHGGSPRSGGQPRTGNLAASRAWVQRIREEAAGVSNEPEDGRDDWVA